MNLEKNFIAFGTIVSRELHRVIFRVWKQTFIPPVINTVLYFIIFGSIIGARIGQMDGVTYTEFLIPGLVTMAVINISFSCIVTGFFLAKFQKYIQELLVSPTTIITIILGYVTAGVLIGTLVGIIVGITSNIFIPFQIHDIPLTILVLIASSTLFALIGLLVAIFARSFDDISIVPTFVIVPLTFLGGVFYSIKLLPEPWLTITHLNPIFYIINGVRYGLLGINDTSVSVSLIMIFISIIIVFCMDYYFLKTGRNIKD